MNASAQQETSPVFRSRRWAKPARSPRETGRCPLFRRGGLALVGLACLTGCSRPDRPPLGRVTGTVTLDGTPLSAALVVFTPDGPGRSAIATTDWAGRYELVFLRDIAGANVGTHTVRITTAAEDRRGKELLPARYHRHTELTACVVSGHNKLDFPLRSN